MFLPRRTRSRVAAVAAIAAILVAGLLCFAVRPALGKHDRRPLEDPILLKIPEAPDLPRLALEIVAQEKEVTNPAIRAPWIEFSIKNVADVPVVVVEPLDGSDLGWRAPKCFLMIWDSAGRRVSLPTPPRCGNMNSLALHDFVTLKPGDSLPIERFLIHPGSPLTAGQYTIQCVYGTEGHYGTWLGSGGFHTPELLSRIDQIPKGTFLSAPLRVQVRQ